MYKEFLKTSADEVLLMYLSEGYSNNSGQGDRGVIGNLYSSKEIEEKIKLWENEVLENINGTVFSINDAYSKDGIGITTIVYCDDKKTYDITNDTPSNRQLLKEIKEQCDMGINNFELLDNISFHARVCKEGNELKFIIYHDSCYQSVGKYITIKKVKKEDVRYCVIIERPVNSKESGQYILAGPYISYEEAKSLLKEFSDETDIYGKIRKPFIIATYTEDKWLKNHFKNLIKN